MSVKNFSGSEPLDLTNCEREPIHIPGCVQPHGALVVLDPHTLRVVAVSANVTALGIEPSQVVGALLDSAFAAPVAQVFRTMASATDEIGYELSLVARHLPDGRAALGHRHDGWLLIEIELQTAPPAPHASETQHLLARTLEGLRSARSLNELCYRACEGLRRLTGFDRVVSYRFDEEWNGNVIAEARNKSVSPFMGLRFPASDIPRQARELYRLNPIRYIPEVRPDTVPVISSASDAIDMSRMLFRAVSPIHLEYLRNMGVGGSTSVPLKNEDRLWGLLCCTHENGPRYLTAEVRAACELIGHVTSSLLTAKEAGDEAEYHVRLKSTEASLLQFMAQKPDFVSALVKHEPSLLDITGATGAAVYLQGQFTVVGEAPNDTALRQIVDWLRTRGEEDLLVTDSLPTHFPTAVQFKDKACGLIAASLSKRRDNFLLWFRPEVIQSIDWGGNPNKSVEKTPEGLRLHPRRSFELWKETVQLRSLPWRKVERRAASDFRSAFIDIVLQRAEEISKLNVELERSNMELDSFAYAASHDLKEPLRGIHNYSMLVARELEKTGVSAEVLDQMGTISKLTQRMESLIDSLLHYSQVGKTELSLREVDLSVVLSQALEMLQGKIRENNIHVRVPRALPRVRCDSVRMGEVFSNLLTNAMKYNDKADRWVEVGYRADPTGTPTFYVRDNGIGIRLGNSDKIFRIFKRLHTRDKFGGGTGTGLTITKRILERHQGKIWLESVEGEGSTFYFRLGDGEAADERDATPDNGR